MLKIKICCISSLEEAAIAMNSGASALGLVSAMPSGPGVIPEARIREISDAIPGRIETFLLTSKTDPRDIVAQHDRCRTTAVQLVDTVAEADLETLRSQLAGVKLVQVIHVRGASAIRAAQRVEKLVDAILLDSGNPSLQKRELGGTGRAHDWTISSSIVRAVTTPVYLAGGINVGNVTEAIRTVSPYGLDLCSSVRTHDRLDEIKLQEFMAAVTGHQ